MAGNFADLYHLPGGASSPRQRFLRRARALVAVSLLIALWSATQLAARNFQYHGKLGRPWWPYEPIHAHLFQTLGVAALVIGALLLVFRRLRVLAVPIWGLALLTYGFSIGPLYSPFHLFIWWGRFYRLPGARSFFTQPLELAALGIAFALVALLVLNAHAASHLPNGEDVHGSARWATLPEIREAHLIQPQASLLGRLFGREKPAAPSDESIGSTRLFLGYWPVGGHRLPLYDAGPHHCFCYAPTRSGKGVGLVIPNLFEWPHSVLVHDIKGENWALTSGHRATVLKNICLRFDPTAVPRGDPSATIEGAARYNPLFEIRPGDFEVRDAQNVADILVDPNGDRPRDHWDRTAHALLTGVILHVLYAEEDKTLHGCANVLAAPNDLEEVNDTLDRIVWTNHLGTHPHPVVASLVKAVRDKAPNERSGVISTALSFLDLYRDPIVAANTAVSDFTLNDLMNAEQAVSLYLSVPPSDISRTRPLVRLLLNQACRRLTESMSFEGGRPTRHYRHPLLLMLDEFPALGRLPFFQESLAYLAGYGIRAFLITQDLSQHQGVYGREESITANCHVRIAFTPNKTETAELLSRMTGEMTVHQKKTSRQSSAGHFLTQRVSTSEAETRRRLLTPDETMRLPDSDELIFVAGQRPIRAKKARYYLDPRYRACSRVPPPQGIQHVTQRTHWHPASPDPSARREPLEFREPSAHERVMERPDPPRRRRRRTGPRRGQNLPAEPGLVAQLVERREEPVEIDGDLDPTL